MATVIDELIVLFGLDPSKFKKGEKEVEASMRDSKEKGDKYAKELESKARAAAQVFDKVRNQAIALGTTFMAGMGLKAFIGNLTEADAAAGRTAKNIGITTEALTAWQGVAERAGGSSQGITASMQGLSQQFQQLQLTGQSSIVPFFRAVGVNIADASGKMRPMSEILLDLSDQMSKMDPARAQALGKGLGLDEGTVNVLMQGRRAIGDLLAEQEKLGAANKADAAAAAERQKQFNALSQASADLGRKLLTALTPAIMAVIKGLTALAEWFSAHPKIFATFAALIGVVALALTTALVTLQIRGFIGLIATMLQVPAAAAAAETALAATAASTVAATGAMSTGILGLLAALAKSAALVVGAGAVGYAIGSAIYNAFLESTPVADWIGKKMAQVAAFFGNKDARESLEADERAQGGAKKDEKPAATVPAGPMPQGTGDRDKLGRLRRPQTASESTQTENSAKPGVPPVAEAQPNAPRDEKQTARPEQREAVNVIVRQSIRKDENGNQRMQLIAPSPERQAEKRAAASSPANATNREQAQSDIRRFMEMGWSREQATGIAANIQRESSGDEKAVGDSGRAYGLAQWHPDRQREFAKQFGKDIRDASRDEQLQFINHELRKGNEQGAGRALAQASTPQEAAAIISKKYERPADAEGEAAKRAQLAASLYKTQPDPALRGSAATAVANNTTNHSTSTSTSQSEVKIGTLNVQLPNATDANSVAKGLGSELKKSMSFAAQANQGLI